MLRSPTCSPFPPICRRLKQRLIERDKELHPELYADGSRFKDADDEDEEEEEEAKEKDDKQQKQQQQQGTDTEAPSSSLPGTKAVKSSS